MHMHRMHRHLVGWSLALGFCVFSSNETRAELLKVTEPLTYPVIAADVNGRVEYHYDASANKGKFSMRNTPVLLATGTSQNPSNEFTIDATSSGDRYQVLQFTIDPTTGKLVEEATNTFQLYGKISATIPSGTGPDAIAKTINYEGLLLEGIPKSFGSLYKGANPEDGILSIFDAALEITGGELAPFFSKDAYIRITPLRENTFAGVFTEDFFATKATSNTMALSHAPPFPIPEPTALLLLVLGGGGGLVYKHRRRLG